MPISKNFGEFLNISLSASKDIRIFVETHSFLGALQRQNAENFKQILQEKEYRGLSPNFHIHVSVSEFYIPTMGLPVLLRNYVD